MATAAAEAMGLSRKDLAERVRAVILRLESEFKDRVSKREIIEQRWLNDLAQFHGIHPEKTLDELKEAEKSQLYINQTRPKTNSMEARLSDMLFPTDDRNWGIGPTPIPELTVESERTARQAAETAAAAAANPDDQKAQKVAQTVDQKLRQLKFYQEEARTRARRMEEEIDDHLTECRYSAQAREVIRDGCKIGTGVMKGPVTDGRTRRSWREREVQGGPGQPPTKVYELEQKGDARPAYWRVDPWNFFPDMDSASMDECPDVFERHLMNKKQLRGLARQEGFDKDAIRLLLREEPREPTPSYLPKLKTITAAYNNLIGSRYHVLEYHGSITYEDVELCAYFLGHQDMLEDYSEDIDPLTEIPVVIWFCDGVPLKIGPHQLDSEESIYSVFNLEKDESSLFGFGIPHIMRDSQSALGAAWRALMDNMALAAGPQVVVDEAQLDPVDNDWRIRPRKTWRRKNSTNPKAVKPFEVFEIKSNSNDLLAVIESALRFIDSETALPMLAQGEQGSQVTKTSSGMSMLMNSVNIVFRRIVKNWDDDMTAPNIRRMYDWLMQFSQKDEIKGDYEVDARGTSVLLVREMQSANLLAFLNLFGVHPVLAKYLKKEGLPAMRRLAQVMMIPADEIVKTDDEVAEDQAKAAKLPPQKTPEQQKLEFEMNLAAFQHKNAMELATMQRETEMLKLAQQGNLKLEEIRAMLANKAADRESAERKMAVEAAVEERNAQRAAVAADKDREVKANTAGGKKKGKKAGGRPAMTAGSGGSFGAQAVPA